jgi:hypothetical protein
MKKELLLLISTVTFLLAFAGIFDFSMSIPTSDHLTLQQSFNDGDSYQ